MPSDESIPVDQYKILVVDLDGTLVNTEPMHIKSYEIILTAISGRPTKVELGDIVGRSGVTIWNELLERFGLQYEPTRLNELRKIVVSGLMFQGEPPLEVNRSVTQLLEKFEGSRVLLTTQDARSAGQILRHTATDGLLDEVISGGSANSKAKLDVIRELAAQQGCDLAQVLWVEDASPEIEAGRSAGIDVAIVRREYNAKQQELASWLL